MPTLTTRNSPSTTASTTVTTLGTSVTMATISTGLDTETTAAIPKTIPSTTITTNSNLTTCTFAAANDDYQQHMQQSMQQPLTQHQQQQQQQQLHFSKHHYHYPPPPQPSSVATNSQQFSAADSLVTTTDLAGTTMAAVSMPNTTDTTTFNGNSNLNVANGNNNSSCSNNNNGGSNNGNDIYTLNCVSSCNKSETSSNAGSIGGGNIIGQAIHTNFMKKTASMHALQMQMNASREDVASLGGASSINSQISASNSNNNNVNNGNNNNGSNNIIKGSKENLLQNYMNGDAGDRSTTPSRNIERDDPGDGLGPLPPKWETAYTERGELYFIDHNTGTSHWLDPRLSKFQKKSLEDCGDDELPYGWEKIEDSLYGTYYIDHVNRRTQYENPVLEAKRRAAEQKQKQQQHQRPQTPSTQSVLLSGIDINSAVGQPHGIGLNANNSLMNPLPSTMDIAQRGMHPPPLLSYPQKHINTTKALLPYKFTRNPVEMQGERITTTLLKSARGLGITIIGGDDNIEEFLQIKSIVPNGPAWLDGQLQTGDVLVYVNDTCVLGFSHNEMVNVFQSILPGETVTLEVCRGYPLPFDPNDPNTEVVTTIAVDGIVTEPEKQRRILMDLNMDGNYNFLDLSGENNGGKISVDATTNGGFILMKKPEVHVFSIVKGAMGFGFTIADSAYGQKVKKILDRNSCIHLNEGDLLLEINENNVRNKSHSAVVQILNDCSKTEPTTLKIQRGATTNSSISPSGNVAKLRKNFLGSNGLFRSKTPTADLYSTQQKEILPIRPKTPLVDTRRARVKTPNNELNDAEVAAATTNGGANMERSLADSKSQVDAKSTNSLQEIDAITREIPFMDPYPKLVTSLSERLAEATLMGDPVAGSGISTTGGLATNSMDLGYHLPPSVARSNYENQEYVTTRSHSNNYNPIYGLASMPPTMSPINPVHNITAANHHLSQANIMPPTYHHESCYCYDCQDYRGNKFRYPQQSANYYGNTMSALSTLTPLSHQHPQYSPATLHYTSNPLQTAHLQNERMQKRVNELLNDRRRVGFSPLDNQLSAHTSVGGGSAYLSTQQQHSPAVSNVSQHALGMTTWSNSGSSASNYNTLQPAVLGATGLLSLRNAIDVGDDTEQYELNEVTLERQALGFGFRIVGGTEEGSQVTVGHIVPGGAADNDHRITTGDEILSIDGVNVLNSSHHKVVSLMGEAALRGQVTMILRRRLRSTHNELLQPQHTPQLLRTPIRFPYDIIVNRHEHEGFGFVIISSSNQYYGSTIGKLIPGSPADRCGELKVGDRIIAVNRIDIAGMSHGDVVNLIKESGLHVRLTIGCPKDVNNATGTTPNTLLMNAAQASPGQVSQTHLAHSPMAQANQKQQVESETATYMERPNATACSVPSTQQLQQTQLPQL